MPETNELALIRANIARIQTEIGGRATLLAATKTVPWQTINAAYDMGLRVIGENRVNELMEKLPYLDPRFEIHFIGTLQKNKVKYLIGKVRLIHSLDGIPLAEEIDRLSAKAGLVTDCLVEVNIGNEESKGGVSPSDVPSFLASLGQFSHLRVRGLMAIPPKTAEKAKKIENFKKIKQIFIDNSVKMVDNISMEILSLGMTGDYAEAIECGSTMVRIGEGIFGKRFYPEKKQI